MNYDGNISVAVKGSLKKELDLIRVEKGYSSYSKVIGYLVEHCKECYKKEGMK